MDKKILVRNPWSFAAPDYDQRSSVFVNAGSHYGSGKPQNVGHEGNPAQRVDAMPFGRHLPGGDKLAKP